MSEPAIVAHLRTVPEWDLDRPFRERRVRLGAVPRVGEHLVVVHEEAERSDALEVLAVVHRADPDSEVATVEVWARFVGAEIDLRISLSRDERPSPAEGKRRRWHYSNASLGWFTVTYDGDDLAVSSAFSLRVGSTVGGDWGVELDGMKTAVNWTAEILGELSADEILRRVRENRTDDKG